MSTRGSSIGANDLTRAPHYAPYSELNRRGSYSACGAVYLPSASSRSHGTRRKIDHASITQSLIDAAAVAFWFLFIALVGVSIIAAILILLFVVSFP